MSVLICFFFVSVFGFVFHSKPLHRLLHYIVCFWPASLCQDHFLPPFSIWPPSCSGPLQNNGQGEKVGLRLSLLKEFPIVLYIGISAKVKRKFVFISNRIHGDNLNTIRYICIYVSCIKTDMQRPENQKCLIWADNCQVVSLPETWGKHTVTLVYLEKLIALRV